MTIFLVVGRNSYLNFYTILAFLVYKTPFQNHYMLTESDLQSPTWLAAIVAGQCVIIRGHVGEHRLEGLKAIMPLGVFQWAPLELPQGEALDPEFFASIMPSQLGEVPRKIHVLPLVASTVQIDALAEVRATLPWLQWIAVVPDPEIDPVLPDGIVLFDAKSRTFPDEEPIPAAAKAWAKQVLGGARSEEEKRRAVAAEGPRILATINAVSSGDYQALPGILGHADVHYVTQLVTIASTIAGVECMDPGVVAAEIEENATIADTIDPNVAPLAPAEPPAPTQKIHLNNPNPTPHPQIFEDGKALPIYPPGDPVGKYSRELDAVRRDPEAHGALLEVLQEFPCESEDGHPSTCADRCNDPAQKWACMRDNAWPVGMPASIVNHWLEVFALMVARAGRNPREAYQSFTNVLHQASATSPTFSAADFEGMVRHIAVPARAPAVSQPVNSPKIATQPALPKPVLQITTKKVPTLPLPLKSQKLPVLAATRAQKLSTRLDSLADRIERVKERLTSNGASTSTDQPGNDPLIRATAASSWEADAIGDEDLSFDTLEKRVARLAQGK